MASPGDPANLQHNLTILAQLVNQGSKLSYSPGAGRFSIDKPGLFQGTLRTLWRDSVTSEQHFGEPIREVFAAAHAEGRNVTAALNGLDTLRASYANEPAKLGILNAVIEDARRGVRKDLPAAIQLRESYQQYLKFGFSQGMFLPESNRGVCYSFTVHWARRILLRKANFGVSAKSLVEENPLRLNAQQKTRLMKKVDIIRPLHAELDRQYRGISAFRGREIMDVIEGDEENRFARKYGNVFIERAMAKERTIDATKTGSEVMQTVVDVARQEIGKAIFLINLRKGTTGHTIGIHLDGLLHFFDSNIGEFAFPIGSDGDLNEFLDRWWQFYRYGFFGLESVSLRNG